MIKYNRNSLTIYCYISLFPLLSLFSPPEYPGCHSDADNDTLFPQSFEEDNCSSTRGTGGFGGGALDNTEQAIIAIGCKSDIHCSGY